MIVSIESNINFLLRAQCCKSFFIVKIIYTRKLKICLFMILTLSKISNRQSTIVHSQNNNRVHIAKMGLDIF
jgi:hypothetical protein